MPSSDRPTVEPTVLPASTTLWRIYRPTDQSPTWNSFRSFGPVSRFDHHGSTKGPPSLSKSRSILYAASSIEGCVLETFGDAKHVAIDGTFCLAGFSTTRDLLLADLRRPPFYRLVERPRARRETQFLSRVIHETTPCDGLISASAYWPDEPLVIIFERGSGSVPRHADIEVSLNPSVFTGPFQRIAGHLGITFGGTGAQEVVLPSGLLGPDGEPISLDSEAGRFVIQGVREISDALLDVLNKSPTELFKLTPRMFEKLVAELLARGGYDVTLTAPSRDGGVDIFAVRRDRFAEFCLAVECKKYRPGRPVGVGVVRALYGVVGATHASAGAIVTTSSFTSGALGLQRELPMQLSLHDFEALRHWIRRLN